jgi:hypothetical protein
VRLMMGVQFALANLAGYKVLNKAIASV